MVCSFLFFYVPSNKRTQQEQNKNIRKQNKNIARTQQNRTRTNRQPHPKKCHAVFVYIYAPDIYRPKIKRLAHKIQQCDKYATLQIQKHPLALFCYRGWGVYYKNFRMTCSSNSFATAQTIYILLYTYLVLLYISLLYTIYNYIKLPA